MITTAERTISTVLKTSTGTGTSEKTPYIVEKTTDYSLSLSSTLWYLDMDKRRFKF